MHNENSVEKITRRLPSMKFNAEKLIILCATQRCGSTMIVEDMRATGVMGIPEEYFIPWDPSKSDIDWAKQLEQIARKSATDNNVASVKIMANQLASIENCLKNSWSGDEPNQTGMFPYFRELTRPANFVFIRRDSIVRQAISRGMSRQTGINHATEKKEDDHFAGNLMKGYEASYNAKVRYDQSIIDSDVIAIAKENLIWESFFKSWGITHPLSLRYEEICKNSPGYLTRIAKACKLELNEEQLPKDRKMVRLSNSKNDEWTSAYMLE